MNTFLLNQGKYQQEAGDYLFIGRKVSAIPFFPDESARIKVDSYSISIRVIFALVIF